MWWKRTAGLGLAFLLGSAVTVRAQAPMMPAVPSVQSPTVTQSGSPFIMAQFEDPGAGGDMGGIPEASRAEQESTSGGGGAPEYGPAVPEDVKPFGDTPLGQWAKERNLRAYGWTNMGYTYSSTGPGILNVEPRENRFGNEFIVNETAFVLEKTLRRDQWDWGFKSLLYGGADAALLRPRGGFTTTDPRFGLDFRELYGSIHAPILTEGGVDFKIGRQTTIIGYESAMSPYRPFYSNAYQWFYAEDGAWTGGLANWHVNKQLDILSGFTLGANTFFTLRGTGPCYIGQVNYWLQEEKKTLATVSVHTGNNAIFTAPGFTPGSNVTVLELRALHNWNKYFTQVVQMNNGWEANMPASAAFGGGNTSFYGLYSIQLLHVTKTLDFNNRIEWFDDCQGSRTGAKGSYEALTIGVDYHPCKALRLRPELRGDFCDHKNFNGGNNAQMTAAFEALFQY